ncbi:MAG TPA: pyridoxal-phosphate dependent enzyme [Arenimonas sp.]|nr:pyridoxal-phosphate dependent enzyme [Arenimonas sp.]HPO23737.1 pyridoxal-phosphate dependent enzyme [Arenimonas sp.]
MGSENKKPVFEDILAAAARIAPYAHVTPVLQSASINELVGAELFFKCENFQRAGAFKFRGACNAVWNLDEQAASNGVVTHSSGNHGAALALAAKTRNIPAYIVVPNGANPAKLKAIEQAGGKITFCDNTMKGRDDAADKIRQQTGAAMVHPYTNVDVIAGQGTAALECLQQTPTLDFMIAPVGGGGLISGTAIAVAGKSKTCRTIGAEPSGAADAYESLQANMRITDIVSNTICDGLRATVGEINLHIMQERRVEIFTVPDQDTIEAMRLIWERLKILVEPSCATVLAAIIKNKMQFTGKKIGLIITGGNVDLDSLPW